MSTDSPTLKTRTVTQKVTVGKPITISLSQASGGGYKWAVKDKSVGVQVDIQTQPMENGVGGNSHAMVAVTATRAGSRQVVLRQERSWNGEAVAELTLLLDAT